MKNLRAYLFVTVFMLYFSLSAQELELARSVFATGGESSTNSGTLHLSWTVGQSGLVGTFTNEDFLTLLAGFQQEDEFVEGISDNTENPISIKVFPNPFQKTFNFLLETDCHGELSYYLYDINGKVAAENLCIPLTNVLLEETVNLANFPPGMYNLVLYIFSDNNFTKKGSVKLIKR